MISSDDRFSDFDNVLPSRKYVKEGLWADVKVVNNTNHHVVDDIVVRVEDTSAELEITSIKRIGIPANSSVIIPVPIHNKNASFHNLAEEGIYKI